MEGAQSVDKSQKPKTNKVHPVNNIGNVWTASLPQNIVAYC